MVIHYDRLAGQIGMAEAVSHVEAVSETDHELVENQLDLMLATLLAHDDDDLISNLASARLASLMFRRVSFEFYCFRVGGLSLPRAINDRLSSLFQGAHGLACRSIQDAILEVITQDTDCRCQIAHELIPVIIGCFRFSSAKDVDHEAMYTECARLLRYANLLRRYFPPHFDLSDDADQQMQIERRVWKLANEITKLLVPVLDGHPLMQREHERREQEEREVI